MLNPLTRVILGYLVSASLIFLALRLKKEYHGFSAVLLSGGMASLYFITYAAYDFYQLIPQIGAFVLMVMFTGFTVFAALQYNLQAIAVIGLAGAYAVPFLLSDGSGRVLILMSYVTIINIGILVISFKKDWRVLFATAFSLTWLIFGSWMLGAYNEEEHFWISLVFATIFFIIFYISFLVSKFIQDSHLKPRDIILVLINCFIYYGSGYAIISNHQYGEVYLGLFTVFNAVLHFIVAFILFKKLRTAKDSFYLVAGLVLSFLTLAVPVQLEGNWVTLIWALEAGLLFWIGRTKQFPVYELISYAIIALAGFSLLQDWQAYNYLTYYSDTEIDLPTAFWNVLFLTSLLVTGVLGFISYQSYKTEIVNTNYFLNMLAPVAKYALPAGFLIVLYVSFLIEINLAFQIQWITSAIKLATDNTVVDYNYDWLSFKSIWLVNYTITFLACVFWVNLRYTRSELLPKLLLVINSLVIFVFLSVSLGEFESLRDTYLQPDQNFVHGFWNIGIRYVGYLFLALCLYVNYRIISEAWAARYTEIERLLFHFTLLTILSSELLSILSLTHIGNGFKLALSILWGCYALFLIVWGFSKNQKYLRVSGMILFGITLVKLFFYDISGMGTLAKTIVLMIMGALLLVASFLYNKRKKRNLDEA
jgi:hypothetical protein